MPDVFISYSRRDSKEFVSRLADALERAGKDVWVDLDDIPPASRWEEDLREGVDTSDSLIFVISPGASASDHCRGELEHAAGHNKRVIPVAHIAVAPVELPAAVAARNWIPAEGAFEDDFERSLAALLTAIDTDADLLRQHTSWERRAEAWAEKDRRASLLARGSDLGEAEAWIAAQTGRQPRPTQLQAEYVAASRRNASRRQRLTLGAALVALALTAALGVFAFIQRDDAIEQRDLARANDLSSAALATLESDPELSLILARKAAEASSTARTEQALSQALSASLVRTTVPVDGGEYMTRLSPDGRWLATATDAGAQLFEASTGELMRELDPGAAYDLAFDAGSRTVYIATDAGIERVDVSDGTREVLLARPNLTTISLSADERTIAAGSADGLVLLVSTASGAVRELTGHSAVVRRVNFAGRGDALVSAASDGTARVWDASSGEATAVLRGRDAHGLDADVSRDRRFVVGVGEDGLARVWDVARGLPAGEPLNDIYLEGRAIGVDMNDEGTLVLLGLQDGSSATYDVATGELISAYRGHANEVVAARFGAAEEAIATISHDGTARVWDAGPRELSLPGSETARAVAWSDDGTLIAAAMTTGEVGVWDSRSGRPAARFPASRAALNAIAFAPNGERVAVGDEDGLVRVWDVLRQEPAGHALAHDDAVYSVDFSPDGSRLASASIDGTVRIWDPQSGGEETAYEAAEPQDYPFEARFSPDGERVVIAAGRFSSKPPESFGALIAEAASGDEIQRLEHRDFIITADFDPEGERVAAGGSGGIGRIWDASSGETLVDLERQVGQLTAVRFAPSGRQIVTASVTGTRIWSAESGLELARIPGDAVSIAVGPEGRIAIAPASSSRVEIDECIACAEHADELLELAAERNPRAPTDAERALYGL